MAGSAEDRNTSLPAPALNAPREAAVVDGASVTFRWEPVQDALRYQLQIARDAAFQELVLERVVEGEASTVVEGEFETDGELFYWRVLAGNDEGWSSGDHVESFVSGTAEMAATHVARPDERMGPYPELIRSASVEAAAEVTGEEKYFEEEAALGVEHEGVEAGQILGIALAIAAAIVMIVITLFQWTRIVETEARAAATGISGYPELREVEMQAEQMLRRYGVVDPGAGTYQIPIDRAMDLVVREAQQDTDTSYSRAIPAN